MRARVGPSFLFPAVILSAAKDLSTVILSATKDLPSVIPERSEGSPCDGGRGRHGSRSAFLLRIAMTSYTPTAFSSAGELVGSAKTVVLEPGNLGGQTLPAARLR